MHRLALVDERRTARSGRASSTRAAARRLADRAVLRARGVQVEEVPHRREEPRVVPGLRDVVGGARLHELDGRFEVGPGRQQDDRQVGMLRADLRGRARCLPRRRSPRAGSSCPARRGPRLRASSKSRPAAGGVRAEHARAVHRQQDVERRAHGLVVVDDEYGALSQTVLKSLVCLSFISLDAAYGVTVGSSRQSRPSGSRRRARSPRRGAPAAGPRRARSARSRARRRRGSTGRARGSSYLTEIQ